MEIDEKIKKKIIENKIILEKDWKNIGEIHVKLAELILKFLEENPEEENVDNQFMEEFCEEFSLLQDQMDLDELEKVKSEEEKQRDMESVQIRIPLGFARYIREEIFPKLRENLNN